MKTIFFYTFKYYLENNLIFKNNAKNFINFIFLYYSNVFIK